MSERERHLFLNGLTEIRAELERGVDRHTKSIVTANIEVLLNHCMRFYERQFHYPQECEQGCADGFRTSAGFLLRRRQASGTGVALCAVFRECKRVVTGPYSAKLSGFCKENRVFFLQGKNNGCIAI